MVGERLVEVSASCDRAHVQTSFVGTCEHS